jgi:hypothetical protein
MIMCEFILAVSHLPHRSTTGTTGWAHGGCCVVFVRGLGRRLLVDFLAPRINFRSCYIYLLFYKTFAM